MLFGLVRGASGRSPEVTETPMDGLWGLPGAYGDPGARAKTITNPYFAQVPFKRASVGSGSIALHNVLEADPRRPRVGTYRLLHGPASATGFSGLIRLLWVLADARRRQ